MFAQYSKVIVCMGLACCTVTMPVLAGADARLSPTTLVASKDGQTLFVACATANGVLQFDTVRQKVSGFVAVPDSPSGLALSADGRQLYVTCAAPESKFCVVDVSKLKIVGTIPVGHTAMAPIVNPDGKFLYICNRFNNDVSVIDPARKKEVCRIAVQREPVAAEITKDGKYLLVANHLPIDRADTIYVAAVVSVIDTASNKVVKELHLPNGSTSLNGIRVSPDGNYAAVTHIVARFNRVPTQVNYGWINANALTLIDLSKLEIHNTVLLDNMESGAANPWGLAWSEDSSTLIVTHAGTHEVSVIDFQAVIPHVLSLRTTLDSDKPTDPNSAFQEQPDLAGDLPFLTGGRERVKLPKTDLGPRSVAIIGHTAYVANYFSDTLSVIDLSAIPHRVTSVPLGPKVEMSGARKGEFYFHDATICKEGWQSCSSCHPDARADSLNWDLANDGTGNPKNTKSLLLAHRTPPAMSLGVRDTAETAVRAGIQHILFARQFDDVASSIDEYLKSLKPVPSPHLVHGKLSDSAKRGKTIFIRAGCATCHPVGIFTDLRSHDVGTSNLSDRPAPKLNEQAYSNPPPASHKTFSNIDCAVCHPSGNAVNSQLSAAGHGSSLKFDTPTLIEVWRTAPYLHDGSAATVRDVVTSHNRHDQHGKTSNLSGQEMDDLCAYVLSL